MNLLKQSTLILLGWGALALSPVAKADPWDQKTTITFSGPVEIPGQILPAGTYVFKLANSSSNRHIVQVLNKDQNHTYGMFLAIPDYRLTAAEKTIVTFKERPGDAPPAIRAWFYPGQNYGHEFVYGKTEARALAKANNVSVPAMPANLEQDTNKADVALNSPEAAALTQAPLTEEESNGEEVDLASLFPPFEPYAQVRPATRVTDSALPGELPHTASNVPLIGIAGLLSLGIAGVLIVGASKAK